MLNLEYVQQMRFLNVEINEIQDIMNQHNVKRWAYIIHDKDKDEEGNLKEPHLHLAMEYGSSRTLEDVCLWLKDKPQFFQKSKLKKKQFEGMCLYLVHRTPNSRHKYQYPLTDVTSNFDFVKLIETELNNINKIVNQKQRQAYMNDIYNKIGNGEIKEYNLYESIDIESYVANKTRIDNAFKYRQMKVKGVNRDMQTLFLTGETGSGKTTLAKHLAAERGYHCYISSGGKNPLDDYKGEECIILDDCRDSTYTLTDLLKLTDNNTESLVGCRFYNKAISECKLLIITSCIDILDWYKGVDNKESLHQLYRRFQQKYYVEHKTITLSSYNALSKDTEAPTYRKMLTTLNPVYKTINPADYNKSLMEQTIAIAKSFGLNVESLNISRDDLPF